jgi:hypothetical protein
VTRAFRAIAPIMVAALLLGTGPITPARGDTPAPGESPVPVLAYYYIWFDEASWSRAKTDTPLLGRYASDDREVMRRHVAWAQDAGIDGFIVSWKSTLVLDRRLEQLIEVANEASFKLAIIYQGLDFDRNPLPIERIAADLDHFIDEYAGEPAFDLFGGPMVIWSGTWEFSVDEIRRVAEPRGQTSCEWTSELEPRCVLLLGSERNPEGVRRLAGIVDGNAYYWSSVNPDTYPGYPEKLLAMRDAVKESDGLWIAPAAPGFDARLVGGTSVVERRNGETLRVQLDAATGSSPDAIGLISWNEFSENSHVEPSLQHGTRALEVLADRTDGRPPAIPDLDSSDPGAIVATPLDGITTRWVALAFLVASFLVSSFVIARRRLRRRALTNARVPPHPQGQAS